MFFYCFGNIGKGIFKCFLILYSILVWIIGSLVDWFSFCVFCFCLCCKFVVCLEVFFLCWWFCFDLWYIFWSFCFFLYDFFFCCYYYCCCCLIRMFIKSSVIFLFLYFEILFGFFLKIRLVYFFFFRMILYMIYLEFYLFYCYNYDNIILLIWDELKVELMMKMFLFMGLRNMWGDFGCFCFCIGVVSCLLLGEVVNILLL